MLTKEEVGNSLIKRISWFYFLNHFSCGRNTFFCCVSVHSFSRYWLFIMFLHYTTDGEVSSLCVSSSPFPSIGLMGFPTPPQSSVLCSSSESKWLKKLLRSLNRNYMRSLSSRTHPWVPVPQRSQCLFQRKHCFCQKTSSTGIFPAAAAKGGSLVCATSAGKQQLGNG